VGDLYMRQYHFPKAVGNLKRKLEKLEREAAALSDKQVLNCLRAANEAWDREVEIAHIRNEMARGDDK
jgi:hypothetical protein